MTGDADRRGRLVALAIGGVAVAFVVVFAVFIGAGAAERTGSIRAFGVLTLPASPLALAAYGVVLSTILLGVFFAAVSRAGRLESER